MPTPRRSSPSRALIAALAVALAILAPGVAVTSSAAPSPAELEAAQQRLAELEREFELVVEEYNLVHDRLARIRTRIAATELVVRRIERRIGATEDSAVELATQLYKGGSTEALELVFSADDLGDIQSRLEYLTSSQKAQTQVFEALAVDRARLEQALADLDEDRTEALAAEERLAALRVDIEAKVETQRDEIAELQAAIERAERARARRAAARRAAAARAAAAAQAAAQAPAAPALEPATSSFSPTTAAAPNARAQVAVEAALSKVGSPYQWGAAGPDSFDCSGLTMWAWAQAGVALPHNSGAQYAATPRVDRADLQPGDLLFSGSPIHHVGMYIGNGQMVEAPYTGASVRVVSAYRSDYVGAGRPGI
jgi:cell wall-associated NlpC family hydrolase